MALIVFGSNKALRAGFVAQAMLAIIAGDVRKVAEISMSGAGGLRKFTL